MSPTSDQENIEPAPVKRARFEIQVVHQVLAPHPLPGNRDAKWDSDEYQVPADAQQVFERAMLRNRIRRLNADTIHALFDLALETRTQYSIYYTNGPGLSIPKEEFLSLLNDPMGLVPQLESIRDSKFSDLENGFLLACRAICRCKIAAGSLGFILFKNRIRDKISKRLNILQ